MPERGVINNRDRGSQIRDFSGLQVGGKITPTDVDMLIEYHDDLFIMAETKFGNAELPTGQRLALARLCDTLQNGGKPSIVFITRHDTPSKSDIDMAQTMVVEYRYRGQWKPFTGGTVTLSEAVRGFIQKKGRKP